MSRLSPTTDTLRALFAKSGNQCAFPNCDHSLISEKNKFIAQVCHIEAANQGGERYNENSTDEERRGFDNLLILCYAHHVETNDTAEYTVEKLKEMKFNHEKSFDGNFKINETTLKKLSSEIEEYWNHIELLNQTEHIYSDLAFQINKSDTFSEIISRLLSSIDLIQFSFDMLRETEESLIDDISKFLHSEKTKTDLINAIKDCGYGNPFVNRNWETFNLTAPNAVQQLHIDIAHMEIKYLEEYLKNNSDDQAATQRFEDVKKKLEEYAISATHSD